MQEKKKKDSEYEEEMQKHILRRQEIAHRLAMQGPIKDDELTEEEKRLKKLQESLGEDE